MVSSTICFGLGVICCEQQIIVPFAPGHSAPGVRSPVPSDRRWESSFRLSTPCLRQPDKTLAKALAWNHALLTGTASSMTELAKREKVTRRYIGHLLQLAFLAPDIIQSIVKGDIPTNLTLDRLEAGFPLDWNEQRKALGFTL